MKHLLRTAAIAAIAILAATAALAQTALTGRTYHNPNIFKDEIEAKMKAVADSISQKRAEAIAKAEKEKGRPLTPEETADIDKQIAEAKKLTQAMATGMTTAVTVDFKSEQKCVMKMDVQIKEEVLKAAGMSWAKRKMIKAALTMAPKSHKAKYTVSGNLVVIDDGEDKDTLTLSADGRYLTGHDKDKKYVLTRTK